MLDLTAFLRTNIEEVHQCYLDDLGALNDDDLAASPGGSARSPLDFTYEVALVNQRVAARLRGEDVGPWPFSDSEWAKAPAEFRSRDSLVEYLSGSVDTVLSALGDANREVVLPSGSKSAFEVAMMVVLHMEYHMAQLNYLQSMKGDAKVHWTA
jgi:hypothetical protein